MNKSVTIQVSCDLLKIHYLCGDKDNTGLCPHCHQRVVICSKFITFVVTKTTYASLQYSTLGCDLLKIHYLCGDKDNRGSREQESHAVVICSKFITFVVTKTTFTFVKCIQISCDLLKIHYLCGDKDNFKRWLCSDWLL